MPITEQEIKHVNALVEQFVSGQPLAMDDGRCPRAYWREYKEVALAGLCARAHNIHERFLNVFLDILVPVWVGHAPHPEAITQALDIYAEFKAAC